MRGLVARDVYKEEFFKEHPDIEKTLKSHNVYNYLMGKLIHYTYGKLEKYEQGEMEDCIETLLTLYGDMRFVEGRLSNLMPEEYDDLPDIEPLLQAIKKGIYPLSCYQYTAVPVVALKLLEPWLKYNEYDYAILTPDEVPDEVVQIYKEDERVSLAETAFIHSVISPFKLYELLERMMETDDIDDILNLELD